MAENLLDDASKDIVIFVTRVLGFFLLLMGLWIALQVLLTAQDLYEHPEEIERFAVAIEDGSNIDKALEPVRDSLIIERNLDGEVKKNTATRPDPVHKTNIRFSYFFAWVIALLLLLLIAMISLTAIKTGGQLILFDMQIKKLARALTKELQKIKD